MPDHQRHFSIGILFYPLFFLLWNLIFNFVSSSSSNFFSIKNVTVSVFTYSLGTVLPDVDIQSSLIHRIIKNLFVIPGVVCIVYYLLLRYLLVDLTFTEPVELIVRTIVIYSSILAGFAAGWLFSKSVKHRGFLHSPFSSILYGGLVFGILVILQFELQDASFLAVISASGYFTHIVTDVVSPLFRRGK